LIRNSKRLGLRSSFTLAEFALASVIGLFLLAACGAREFNPDAGWSGVIDGGDVVYVGTMDRQVIALDAENGLLQASFPAEPDGEYETFRAIYGTPALVDGRIYVGGFNGKVYALDAQSLESAFAGAVFDVESDQLSKGVIGAVAVEEGRVVFGAAEDSESGRLYVLDAEDFREVCRFPARSADPIGKVWSTPAIVDGVAYFGDLAHRFYAVAIDDCSLQWAAPVELAGGIASTPLVQDGTVYIGSFDRSFYAIDLATGAARVLFKAGSWFWSGVVTDGRTLFVPNLDGKLYAMDLATESVVWEFDTEGAILSTPVLVGDQVVVASDSGQLSVVDAASGVEVWSRQLSGQVRAPLMARGSVVYLSTLDHKIEAIDVVLGRARWSEPASTKR